MVTAIGVIGGLLVAALLLGGVGGSDEMTEANAPKRGGVMDANGDVWGEEEDSAPMSPPGYGE